MLGITQALGDQDGQSRHCPFSFHPKVPITQPENSFKIEFNFHAVK